MIIGFDEFFFARKRKLVEIESFFSNFLLAFEIY
jgi:hypothetical protein